MRLRAALVGPSRSWEQLLIQEGLPYAVVDVTRENLGVEYSVAIVHRPTSGVEREVLENYLRGGGALLGVAASCTGIAGTESRREQLRYLLGDGQLPFRSVLLIDLSREGAVPREASVLRSDQNNFAAFAGPLGGGWAVLLPFDPGEATADIRSAQKSFYSRYERLPSEHVSLVAKGEVRHLVREALEYLHLVRGIPYVHLWYFPEGGTNVFAFRVDTDGAARADIDPLLGLAREHGIGLSWFLDVQSHEALLPHFEAMVGQEIGVHCFEHRVSDVATENLENFSKAKRVLEAVGLQPEGLAVPFGRWTPLLASQTAELGFRYSSEFSFAYDTFPLSPASTEEVYGVLQVPIHPVCVGSLRQVGYAAKQMAEYFAMVAGWKMRRREPLFFYHHPSHRAWDVVASILERSNAGGVLPLTFGAYVRWWEQRAKIRPAIHLEGEWLRLDAPSVIQAGDAGAWMRIVRPNKGESIIPLATQLDLDLLSWSEVPTFTPPEDIRRVREFDPRRLLGNFSRTFLRRFE
jgi:hypothetical protein